MIHREGTATLLLAFLILGGASILTWMYANAIISSLTIITSIILFIFFLQFFRNPKRLIKEKNENLIYAPADGRVVVIEETQEDEYLKNKCRQVSIFMSPLNVHANRAPIKGKVLYDKYHPGKYLVAWHPKSSTENERTTIVFEGKMGKVLMRQIAGALARRIKYYVKENQQVEQGEEIGFIKLGSRVDLYLPLDAEILVQKEQMVKGNIDIIAKFKS